MDWSTLSPAASMQFFLRALLDKSAWSAIIFVRSMEGGDSAECGATILNLAAKGRDINEMKSRKMACSKLLRAELVCMNS